jgi:hypothetical protein
MRPTLLSLAIALGACLLPAAASAQQNPPAAPTIRPEIAPPLQAAQKALNDKQFEQALQHLAQAEAVPDRTPHETYLLERMRFLASAGLRDVPATLKALEAALATGQAEPELRATLMDQASNAAYALKDYEKTVLWARRALEAGATGDNTRLRLAQALYLQARHPQAAQALDELGARQRSEGRKPGEPQLRLQASNLLKMGDEAGYARVLEDLLAVAPKPEIWADRLARLSKQPGFDDALTADLFRLSRRVGAFATAEADLEYAERVLDQGYPAEAQRVLEAGQSAGRLGAAAPVPPALRERVDKALAADRAAAPPVADELLARDPRLAFDAGWALYTDGRAEPGLALMRQAVARGFPQAQRARLRLAQALAAQGDAAGARAELVAARDAGGQGGASDLARLALIALDAPR